MNTLQTLVKPGRRKLLFVTLEKPSKILEEILGTQGFKIFLQESKKKEVKKDELRYTLESFTSECHKVNIRTNSKPFKVSDEETI